MSLNSDLLKFVPVSSTLARDVAKMQKYAGLWEASSTVGHAMRAWHESQREQQECLRKMFEPLGCIHRSALFDYGSSQLVKSLVAHDSSMRDQFKNMFLGTSGVGSLAKMWSQQMGWSRFLPRHAFESVQLGSASTAAQYLKDFEQVNKHWRVPSELLGVVGSLKALQDQIGNIALPTIDWGSAAALVNLVGKDGLEEQLAHLGIGPDGSLRESSEVPEKGLMSRKQSDAVSLVGLLLAIIGMWMTIQIWASPDSPDGLLSPLSLLQTGPG